MTGGGVVAGFLDESGGYALADFVPFSAEVYFRLIERVGETFWPLHGPALLLGLVAVWLAWRGRPRTSCALLAVPWAWVGVTFLGQRYAELNWAGGWFAGGFLVEAGILLLVAATGAGVDRIRAGPAVRQPRAAHTAGLVLATFGIAVYPIIGPLSGFAPIQAETFGIHPDPTAVATLGVALVALRGAGLWIAALVPLLWCAVTGLTLQVLDAAWAIVPPAAAAVAVILMAWKSVRSFAR